MSQTSEYEALETKLLEIDEPSLLTSIGRGFALIFAFLINHGGGALTISITPDGYKQAFHLHARYPGLGAPEGQHADWQIKRTYPPKQANRQARRKLKKGN